MPKTAYLAEHFSSSELKEKYLKSQNSVEMRRWHLLWKIFKGWTIKNSTIAVDVLILMLKRFFVDIILMEKKESKIAKIKPAIMFEERKAYYYNRS